jgi:hypothetical protein
LSIDRVINRLSQRKHPKGKTQMTRIEIKPYPQGKCWIAVFHGESTLPAGETFPLPYFHTAPATVVCSFLRAKWPGAVIEVQS